MLYQQKLILSAAAIAVAAMLGVAPPQEAMAAASFDMNISFSEAMLAAHGTAQEDLVAHYEGWDSAIARIRKRNMPFIEITNTSPASMPANLTQFQMTIAKPQYEFGDDVLGAYALLGTTTPGVNITSASPDDGTTLIVNLTDGLAPGDTVRFQVDIDVDAAYPNEYPFPDYRMVFFDVNSPVNDLSDNSVVTVSFSDNSVIQQTLPDFEQSAPLYVNGGALRNYRDMDPVEMFELNGQVPEPTSGMIAMLVGCCVTRLRRR